MRRRSPPEPVSRERDVFGEPAPTWQDILRAAARRHRERGVSIEPEARPRGLGLGGCLVRAVLLIILLVIGMATGVFGLFFF